MPTYEYECRSCGYTFEKSQNMSEDPIKDCPECGKDVRRIIFGGSGVIFKGSGFYVNDSRGKKSAVGSGPSDAKTGEAKAGDKRADKGADKGAEGAQAKQSEKSEKSEKKTESAAPSGAKESS